MAETDDWDGPSKGWRSLPFEGTTLTELVHYACPKDPEGRLAFGDGRVIDLSIGNLYIKADAALQLSMQVDGDSSYMARYRGKDLVVERFEVRGCDPSRSEWYRDFCDSLDHWITGGFSGTPGWVVDVRCRLGRREDGSGASENARGE